MEIEMRAFLDDLKTTEQKLVAIGAKKIEIVHIVDRWFCEKRHTNFDEIQMRAPGSYSLRIRSIDDGMNLPGLKPGVSVE